MDIILYTEELVKQLRLVSHREVAVITDVEARYRAEAGSEKIQLVNTCLVEAARKLEGRCRRFLTDSIVPATDNLLVMPETFTYEFAFSERRSVNKADALTIEMNTFVLEYALSRFYSVVSQGELSNKHSLLALEAGNVIEELLFTKEPPRI